MSEVNLKDLLQISAYNLHEKEDDDFFIFHMKSIILAIYDSILEDTTFKIVNSEKFSLATQCFVNFCSGVNQANLVFELLENDKDRTRLIHTVIILLNNSDLKDSTKGVLLSLLCNLSRSTLWISFIAQKVDCNIINCEDHLKSMNGPLLAMFLLNMTTEKNFRQHFVKSSPASFPELVNMFDRATSENACNVVAGIFKNCLFEDVNQSTILNSDVALLGVILKPLCSHDDVIHEEDRQKLPQSIQNISGQTDTIRTESDNLKTTILELLLQICSTPSGREYLRSNGVYFLLRELHKFELKRANESKTVRELVFLSEQVVDQLICEEYERSQDTKNLRSVEVHDEFKQTLEKEKRLFINDGTAECTNPRPLPDIPLD